MAVRFNGNTANYLSRTSGTLLGAGTAARWTVMLWANFVSLPSYSNIFYAHYTSGTGVVSLQLEGNKLNVWTLDGTSGSTTITTGTWYHITFTKDGDDAARVYLNGVSEANRAIGSTTGPAVNYIGSWEGSGDAPDARYAACKIWTAALTADEIASEMRVVRPVRIANLFGWYPMFGATGEQGRDYSGNGYDFATVGTLTAEDGPPVSWGGAVYLPLFVSSAGLVSKSDTEVFSWASTPTLQGLLTNTDSHTLADISALRGLLVGIDTHTLADAGVLRGLIAGTDNPTLAEGTPTLQADLTATDSSTLSDTPTLRGILAGTDTLSLSDVGVLRGLLAGADTFTLADTLQSLGASLTPSEVFQWDATPGLQALLTSIDSAASSSSAGILGVLTQTDLLNASSSGALLGRMAQTDTLSFGEVSGLTAAIVDIDAHALSDYGSLGKLLLSSDTFTLSETALIAVYLSQTDSGAVADSGSLLARLANTEAGSWADSSTLVARISSTETGAIAEGTDLSGGDYRFGTDTFYLGGEQVSLTATLSSSDAISLADAGSLIALFQSADSFTISQEGDSLTAYLQGVEIFTGSEVGSASSPLKSETDAFGFVEQELLQAVLSASDVVAWAESATLEASIGAVETFNLSEGGPLLLALLSDSEIYGLLEQLGSRVFSVSDTATIIETALVRGETKPGSGSMIILSGGSAGTLIIARRGHGEIQIRRANSSASEL